jgi:hypothetical protein
MPDARPSVEYVENTMRTIFAKYTPPTSENKQASFATVEEESEKSENLSMINQESLLDK